MTQHITQELLPCPFCGSTEQTYDNCDHGSGQWYTCEGCGVQVKVPYRQDLKEAWNRRAALAQPASIDSIDTSRERVEKDAGNVQVSLQSSEPAAVSGWKLVPVDATRNQLVTGWHAIAGKLDHQSLAHLYGVMLAASPTGEPS